MPREAVMAPSLITQPEAAASRQPTRTEKPVVIERLPKLVHYKDMETLKEDLMISVGPIALFFLGEDTPRARRSIYYQYERGNLPGAVEYGSSVAASKILARAAMWAESIKAAEPRKVQLMELFLQLNELGTALATCPTATSGIPKLTALLAAARERLGAALELPPRPSGTGGVWR